jgi:hypothetical protein
MTTPGQPIPDLPAPETISPAPKWWGRSLTIWGAIVTALSTVLPLLGPAFGFSITPELVQQLGDNVVVLAQALGGVAGTVMAIWGRIRATAPIARRQSPQGPQPLTS